MEETLCAHAPGTSLTQLQKGKARVMLSTCAIGAMVNVALLKLALPPRPTSHGNSLCSRTGNLAHAVAKREGASDAEHLNSSFHFLFHYPI